MKGVRLRPLPERPSEVDMETLLYGLVVVLGGGYISITIAHVLAFGFIGISPKFRVCLKLAVRCHELFWNGRRYETDVMAEYRKNNP